MRKCLVRILEHHAFRLCEKHCTSHRCQPLSFKRQSCILIPINALLSNPARAAISCNITTPSKQVYYIPLTVLRCKYVFQSGSDSRSSTDVNSTPNADASFSQSASSNAATTSGEIVDAVNLDLLSSSNTFDAAKLD